MDSNMKPHQNMNTLEKLWDAYGGVWGERPKYDVANCKVLVAPDAMRRGYWDWVLVNLEEDTEMEVE